MAALVLFLQFLTLLGFLLDMSTILAATTWDPGVHPVDEAPGNEQIWKAHWF